MRTTAALAGALALSALAGCAVRAAEPAARGPVAADAGEAAPAVAPVVSPSAAVPRSTAAPGLAAPAPATPTGTAVGGSSSATGTPTATPTAPPLRVDAEQARRMLLPPGDLPGTYQVDPLVDQSTPTDLPPGCPQLDRVELALGQAQIRAARGYLGGPLGPFAAERVAVVPDAAALLSAVVTASTRCAQFTSRDGDGGSVRFTVTRSPEPAWGEAAVALVLEGTAPGTGTVRHEFTVARWGDTVATVVLSGYAPLDPTVSTTAAAAIQRIVARF